MHGYSAHNAGDGLLVSETLEIIADSLGECRITILASQPETFRHLNATLLPTVPTVRGWDRRTLATLKNINKFDVVIAVGGGYLRAGTLVETLKTLLVHGPQLLAASRANTPTFYLPQSIGPARFGVQALFRTLLKNVSRVYVRDDRSLNEFAGINVRRFPDLAAATASASRPTNGLVDPTPVLSIRDVHGSVKADIHRVARMLGTYDAYIQSTTRGNDDRPATATLCPRRLVSRKELMTRGGTPRVVLAVRLHAALMALAAGHYVIHLAYERKGFGAFSDLGLSDWVHSVNSFPPSKVFAQLQELLTNPAARDAYDARLADSASNIANARNEILEEIRAISSANRQQST
nr:polysaccharide pyruvyl transferase family protein [Zhihengliuella flava]